MPATRIDPAAIPSHPVVTLPAGIGSALEAGWHRLVASGELIVEGEGARFGVRQGPTGYQDFAEANGQLEVGSQRRVTAPDLVFQHSPAREHKPGGRRTLIPGRQIHACFEGDGRPCRFLEEDPQHPHSVCRREPLAWVELRRSWGVLPNLSPYSPDGTFLALPSPRPGQYPHEPQRLGRVGAQDLLSFAVGLERYLVFYNGPHAGASVNHLHFQMVPLRGELPLERAAIVPENGVARLADYPARGLSFDVAQAGQTECLLRTVDALERRHRCYNLLAIGQRAWLFVRHPDREVVEGFPGIVAGSELGGVILFNNLRHYRETDPAAVAHALTTTTLSVAELEPLLG